MSSMLSLGLQTLSLRQAKWAFALVLVAIVAVFLAVTIAVRI